MASAWTIYFEPQAESEWWSVNRASASVSGLPDYATRSMMCNGPRDVRMPVFMRSSLLEYNAQDKRGPGSVRAAEGGVGASGNRIRLARDAVRE